MPEQFELTGDQLAATYQLAGIEQGGFGQAPPTDVLAGSDVLGPDGQSLRPGVGAALRVVHEPGVLVNAVANRSGEPVWTQAWVATTGGPPFVVQTQTETTNAYRSEDESGSAAVALIELCGLPREGGADAGVGSIYLDLAGFAALVALVDADQAETLRARLERRQPDPGRPATAEAMADQLHQGATAIDSTWLVTAARPITPVDMQLAVDRLGDGLTGLIRAGLVVDRGSGHELSDTGRALVDALAATTATAGFHYQLTGPDGQPTLDHVAVYSGPATTFVARWSAVSSSDAAVELTSGGADHAVRTTQQLLDRAQTVALAAATERATAEAARLQAEEASRLEAERQEAERRAAEEAARLEAEESARQQAAAAATAAAAAAAAQPVWAAASPEPAAVAAAAVADPGGPDSWSPTHRVPAVGMWAWNDPDPAAQPVTALDPHLDVQAVDHRGDWVKIVCSNGWQAWVDGRQLVTR